MACPEGSAGPLKAEQVTVCLLSPGGWVSDGGFRLKSTVWYRIHFPALLLRLVLCAWASAALWVYRTKCVRSSWKVMKHDLARHYLSGAAAISFAALLLEL
jgi:hypothetical protein